MITDYHHVSRVFSQVFNGEAETQIVLQHIGQLEFSSTDLRSRTRLQHFAEQTKEKESDTVDEASVLEKLSEHAKAGEVAAYDMNAKVSFLSFLNNFS